MAGRKLGYGLAALLTLLPVAATAEDAPPPVIDITGAGAAAYTCVELIRYDDWGTHCYHPENENKGAATILRKITLSYAGGPEGCGGTLTYVQQRYPFCVRFQGTGQSASLSLDTDPDSYGRWIHLSGGGQAVCEGPVHGYAMRLAGERHHPPNPAVDHRVDWIEAAAFVSAPTACGPENPRHQAEREVQALAANATARPREGSPRLDAAGPTGIPDLGVDRKIPASQPDPLPIPALPETAPDPDPAVSVARGSAPPPIAAGPTRSPEAPTPGHDPGSAAAPARPVIRVERPPAALPPPETTGPDPGHAPPTDLVSVSSASGSHGLFLGPGVTRDLFRFGLILVAGTLLLVLPYLILYRRIGRDGIFASPRRQAILKFIQANPGADAAHVARVFNIHYKSARHHLDLLREVGALSRRVLGDKARYFENHGRFTPEEEHLLCALSRENTAFLRLVAASPGIPQKAAGIRLGLTKGTISRRAGILEAAGLLSKGLDGLRLTPAGARALLLQRFSES